MISCITLFPLLLSFAKTRDSRGKNEHHIYRHRIHHTNHQNSTKNILYPILPTPPFPSDNHIFYQVKESGLLLFLLVHWLPLFIVHLWWKPSGFDWLFNSTLHILLICLLLTQKWISPLNDVTRETWCFTQSTTCRKNAGFLCL